MSRMAYWPNEQLCNVPQQAVIGRDPNRVLRTTLFQCFVDFWLRKSGISPEPDFLALLPLPFDLRQQKLLPAIGAVNVSWPQLSGHAVALAVSLPRMRKLGLGSPSMLYSNRRNALVLQLYLLPDGEKGQRPGPEGPRN